MADIPRTYLAEVAGVILFKLQKNPTPLAVEQAIVDLQGVIRLKENNALNRVNLSPFEEAAVVTLEEMPLDGWLVEWKRKQAAEKAEAEEAQRAHLQRMEEDRAAAIAANQVPAETGAEGTQETPPAPEGSADGQISGPTTSTPQPNQPTEAPASQ